MAKQSSVVGRRSSETAVHNAGGKLRITLVRSLIGRPEAQRQTIRALGLTKVNQTVEKENIPQIRGMVDKVRHLIRVEEA